MTASTWKSIFRFLKLNWLQTVPGDTSLSGQDQAQKLDYFYLTPGIRKVFRKQGNYVVSVYLVSDGVMFQR